MSGNYPATDNASQAEYAKKHDFYVSFDAVTGEIVIKFKSAKELEKGAHEEAKTSIENHASNASTPRSHAAIIDRSKNKHKLHTYIGAFTAFKRTQDLSRKKASQKRTKEALRRHTQIVAKHEVAKSHKKTRTPLASELRLHIENTRKTSYVRDILKPEIEKCLRVDTATPAYHMLIDRIGEFIGNTMDAGGNMLRIQLFPMPMDEVKSLADYAQITTKVMAKDNGHGFPEHKLKDTVTEGNTRLLTYNAAFKKELGSKSGTSATGGQGKGLMQTPQRLKAFDDAANLKTGNYSEGSKETAGACLMFTCENATLMTSADFNEAVAWCEDKQENFAVWEAMKAQQAAAPIADDSLCKPVVDPDSPDIVSSTTMFADAHTRGGFGASLGFNLRLNPSLFK